MIHRANPALRETDKVLDDPRGPEPRRWPGWRATRTRCSRRSRARGSTSRDFIVQANETGQATAERRGDIALGITACPSFLRELRPADGRPRGLRPTRARRCSRDLGAAAPDLGRLIKAQGTLADASRDAFPSLGDALERGRPALIHARPLIQDLGGSASSSRPVSVNLDELTTSLDKTGAIERHQRHVFYYVALATNGFDSLGHYLRAGLVTNTCTEYATVPTGVACTANFTSGTSRRRGGRPAAAGRPRPRAGQGREGRQRPADRHPAARPARAGRIGSAGGPRARARNLRALRKRATQGSPGLGAREPMLDYLLGGDAVSAARRSGTDGEPRARGRRDGARDDRRRLPVLQRQLGPAVRADLRPEGEPAERRAAREGLRGAHRRRARGRHLEDRAAAARRTARPTPRSR